MLLHQLALRPICLSRSRNVRIYVAAREHAAPHFSPQVRQLHSLSGIDNTKTRQDIKVRRKCLDVRSSVVVAMLLNKA
jgi:hypothetical protein